MLDYSYILLGNIPGMASIHFIKKICYFVLLALTVAYVFVCPFSKVEESFNTQAIHDLLIHGPTNLEEFDHLEFPGVVPRSFIGPLMVYVPLWPIAKVLEFQNIPKMYLQYAARAILGCMVMGSLIQLLEAAHRRCQVSEAVICWTTIAICTQFHFIFYASRTLPNIFALIFALQSLRYWLARDLPNYIIFSMLTVVVFRAELVLLLGPLGLYLMLSYYSFKPSVPQLICVISQCLFYGGMFLGLTMAIDSYFWKKSYYWPEGEVFWYNTVLNKSSEWGTSPFLWYFYSVLPRAMFTSFMFIPIAILRGSVPKQIAILFGFSYLFVLMFSFLPHKELRFITYVFPVLNLVAAFGCQSMCLYTKRPFLRPFFRLMVIGHFVINLLLTGIHVYCAVYNYPGGYALQALHKMLPPAHYEGGSPNFFRRVHIDVFSAQTGISRFGQTRDDILIYNKTENLSNEDLMGFDFQLVEIGSKEFKTLIRSQSFVTVENIDGFSSIPLLPISYDPPFIDIKIEPKIAVLLNRNIDEAKWL